MYLLVTSEGCCHCGIYPQVFVNYCECSSIPLILKANLKGGYGARLTIMENHSVDHRNTRIFSPTWCVTAMSLEMFAVDFNDHFQELPVCWQETLCRMGDLKTAVENGQQSLEGGMSSRYGMWPRGYAS